MRVGLSTYHRRDREVEIARRIAPPEHGCWPWKGRVDPKGYGQLPIHGTIESAHRAVYEWLVGPIPDGMSLDHLCRNPGCVNPEHLEPVAHRENVLRGVGPTAVNATKTHCQHGHPLSGANLFIDIRGGRQCRQCRLDRQRERTARSR